jgi:tetratricopeptide (TPR) repeat protein
MESTPWGKGFGFALNAAGIIHSKLKQESVAEESFKEAIKVLGDTKMDPQYIPLYLASCMNNYGVLLLQMGRFEEAIEKLGAAVQILREYMKLAPELHPGWVAEILTNFAVVQKHNGNLDYSVKLLKEALDLETRLVDIAPESYLHYKMHTLQVYSSLLRQKGDREEAKALLEESLSLAKKCSDLEMSIGEPGIGGGDDARFLVIY